MAVLKTRQGQHSQFIFVVFRLLSLSLTASLLCFSHYSWCICKIWQEEEWNLHERLMEEETKPWDEDTFLWLTAFQHELFSFWDVYWVYTHPMGISNCSCWHLVHEGEDEKESSLFGHGLSFKWCLYHRICISCTACMSWHQAMFPFFVRFMNHWNVTRTIIHCAEGYLTSICTYRQASPISFVWVEQKVVVVDFISHGVCFFSKAICTWKYSPKTNMTMEKHRKNNNSKMYFLLNWWFSSQPY